MESFGQKTYSDESSSKVNEYKRIIPTVLDFQSKYPKVFWRVAKQFLKADPDEWPAIVQAFEETKETLSEEKLKANRKLFELWNKPEWEPTDVVRFILLTKNPKMEKFINDAERIYSREFVLRERLNAVIAERKTIEAKISGLSPKERTPSLIKKLDKLKKDQAALEAALSKI